MTNMDLIHGHGASSVIPQYLDALSASRLAAVSRASYLLIGQDNASVVSSNGDNQDIESLLKIATIVQEYANERTLYDPQFVDLSAIILGYAYEDGGASYCFDPIGFASELACRIPREGSVLRYLLPQDRQKLLRTYQEEGNAKSGMQMIRHYHTLTRINPIYIVGFAFNKTGLDSIRDIATGCSGCIHYRRNLSINDRTTKIREIVEMQKFSWADEAMRATLMHSTIIDGPNSDSASLSHFIKNLRGYHRKQFFEPITQYDILSKNSLDGWFGQVESIKEAQLFLTSPSSSTSISLKSKNRVCAYQALHDFDGKCDIEFTLYLIEQGANPHDYDILRSVMRSQEIDLIQVFTSQLSEIQRGELLLKYVRFHHIQHPSIEALLSSGPISTENRMQAFKDCIDSEFDIKLLNLLYDPSIIIDLHDPWGVRESYIDKIKTKLKSCTDEEFELGKALLKKIEEREPSAFRFQSADHLEWQSNHFE